MKALTLVLLLAAGAAPLHGQTGFSPQSRPPQLVLERLLLEAPRGSSAEAHSRNLAQRPHVAGTDAQRQTADYVMRQMAGYGLDTVRVGFRVYLPYHDSTVVELVAPSGQRLVLEEPSLAEDPATQGAIWPAMNGYSGAGDVSAGVVYAHYGLAEDYARLAQQGVEVSGKVVIARYGRSFRGIKAREAEANGAAALLLYSDPQDDGYFLGAVYPKGPMRPPEAVQRGSLYLGRGDPSTPGWASEAGAPRLAQEEMAVPGIPVVPLAYGNASLILEQLAGPSVPQDWQGALPFRYHSGGAGAVTVRVAVWPERGERAYKEIVNTFGIIRGSDWPEEMVIAGGHRDAWGPGAVDNVSGIVSLLEASRAWGEAAAAGMMPRRTLVFATWDAEEWGLVGSVEWVESMADSLQRFAVAYLNQDVAVAGRDFGASGSASLHPLVREVANDLTQPGDTVSVLQAWRSRTEVEEGQQVSLGNLGGGSDFAGFYNHLGIPSFGFGFGGRYGVYHAAYDTYHYMASQSDPGFLSHAAAGRAAAIAMARLANAEVVPLDYREFGSHMAAEARRLPDRVGASLGADDIQPVVDAFERLSQAGAAFNETRERVLAGPPPDLGRLAQVNGIIRRVEQALARQEGLQGRPWMRNLTFAADRNNGYATIPLPSIAEAAEDDERDRMIGEIRDLVERIDRAEELVRSAAGRLEEE